jgi:S-adenosylmethionine:diacylglycerol 3-amino-3-carboxypropyl transferase
MDGAGGRVMRSWLESVLFRDVVFAMDWEDPATQDTALAIAPTDRVLTITAGGCNALSLLLTAPASLVCVDGNAAQTRLLELKIAAAASLPHDAFFDIFAARAPERIRVDYPARIRRELSPAACASCAPTYARSACRLASSTSCSRAAISPSNGAGSTRTSHLVCVAVSCARSCARGR